MPLAKLFGERLLGAAGKELKTVEALRGASAIGLYFSASWCPPCRQFTPQLIESYTKHLQPKGFQCVLVSSDHDEAAFSEYHSKMPWLALPYEDRSRKEALSAQFGVRTIPTLALVDPEGKTITTEARDAVVQDPEGKDFPWTPPAVRDLAHGIVGRMNELPSVVLLCEAADEAFHQKALADLTSLAAEWAPTRGPNKEYAYFVGTGGPLSERIRQVSGLERHGEPQLLILDIPDQGAVYKGPGGSDALKEGAVGELLKDWEALRLERGQLNF